MLNEHVDWDKIDGCFIWENKLQKYLSSYLYDDVFQWRHFQVMTS